MADNEKQMIENYEVKATIHIGGKEVILAEDSTASMPYMVTDCKWDNAFGMSQYSETFVFDDYLEAMADFTGRIDEQVKLITAERKERGVTNMPLTSAYCIKGSHRANYNNKLVVISPAYMAPYARTADKQIMLATGGNGCDPNGIGTSVFCTDLFTGKQERWRRHKIAGILAPEKTPEWVAKKLAVIRKEQPRQKESIKKQLENGKKAAGKASANKVKQNRKDEQEI